MSALANASAVLASAVADDATFTLSYPAGFTRASLIGTTGGKLVINDNDVYNQADPGFSATFGASNITITNLSGVSWAAGSRVTVSFGDTPRNGSYNLTLGNAAGQAAPGDARPGRTTQELTASGAVLAAAQFVELNHASTIVAATMNALEHAGLFVVRDTSASGTAAHTLTLSNGTFDGTNNRATLNAPGEALVVVFDGLGRGNIVENTGAVALSAV